MLQKYCEGEYGFEHHSARNGSFQFEICKSVASQSSSFLGFQSYVASGAIELLGQIGEEALIIQIDDWRRGI